MPVIRPLDPALANKIAAGEVIERPASVVKELVENALDAGAQRIDVAVEEGGSKLIRVTDDGRGMAREDLPLAVAAHATSKIYTDDDLFHIRTLGFRGEALASIGSVSHLRMVSRPPNQLEAHELACDAADENAPEPQPCAAPPGTTVEVRNLFFNVPARRKFLRRSSTELGHITEQLARIALAHPEVHFTLTHNGRSARNLPVTTDRRARIADFYGPELAACLIAVDREERDLRVEALFAPPADSRGSTKWQYLFLNGRYIQDRRVTYAVREAFRGLVEHDRYPVVFLFLTAPADRYDVNVHPTKIEVRWRDAGLVQSQVLAVLRETLLSHDLTPKLSLAPSHGSPFLSRDATGGGGTDPGAQARAREALAEYLKSIEPSQARIRMDHPPLSAPRSAAGFGRAAVADGPYDADGAPASSFPSAPRSSTDTDAHTEPPPDAQPAPTDGPPGSVLQVHNTYIVAQTDEGMIIIDQHALHERILYEQFRRRLLSGALESQRMLIPETIEAAAPQMEAAQQHAALLARLGIELAPFGPNTLAVQAFPILLSEVDIRGFVGDLLDQLAEPDAAASEETAIHAALDMMACKAAVKSGDPLSREEMHTLLSQRHLIERSGHCPHGRPTTLQLSTRDLERQFRRI